MILAKIDTGHYAFETLTTSEDEARRLMFEAWRNHCTQNPRADRGLMVDLISGGEMNVYEIEVGEVLRDGSRIV